MPCLEWACAALFERHPKSGEWSPLNSIQETDFYPNSVSRAAVGDTGARGHRLGVGGELGLTYAGFAAIHKWDYIHILIDENDYNQTPRC